MTSVGASSPSCRRMNHPRGRTSWWASSGLLLSFMFLLALIFNHCVEAFSTRNWQEKSRHLLSLRMGRHVPPKSQQQRSLRQSLLMSPFQKFIFQPLVSSPSNNIWRSSSDASSSMSSSSSEDYDSDFSTEKNTSKLILEAESLRAQAKAIMEQALTMEQELKESRSKARKSKVRETDEFIEQWFRVERQQAVDVEEVKAINENENENENDEEMVSISIANTTTVADRLENENATPEQVLLVVDRIFERRMEASGSFLPNGNEMSPDSSSGSGVESGPISHNETEYERLSDILETLSRAITLVDERVNNSTLAASSNNNSVNKRWSGRVEPAVQARLNELRRTQKVNLDRQLAAELSKAAKSAAATDSMEEYVRRNLVGQVLEETGAANSSSPVPEPVQENMAFVPLWVPSAFLPFIIASKSSRFGPEQVKVLKDQVLMGSRFYVTSHSSVPGAAIFRGNIRAGAGTKSENFQSKTQHYAGAFEDIQKRLQKVPDLQDRVQLFLLPDPEWMRSKNDDQEPEPKPVVLALSKDISPDESKISKGSLVEMGKKLLYPLALFTTIRYSIEGFSLNQIFFDALVKQRNMKVLLTTCFPVVGGILGMHLLQEVVHYLVAKWRRIKIGPPVPIPSLAVGLFGCITPIRSFPSNRAALLDFALSGPFATTVASVGCIIASVLLTVRASPAALANFPVLPTMIFKSSFLAGTLTSWIASKAMMLPLAQPIPVHPLFLVGYSGLIASGLNLLPIFRLDGGRACSAAMGSRQGAVISVSVLLFLLSLALSGGSGIGFSWGMIVAIFQRQQEIPARDDVTEVDNVRLGAWLFSFLLAIGILTPFPGAPSIL